MNGLVIFQLGLFFINLVLFAVNAKNENGAGMAISGGSAFFCLTMAAIAWR